MDLITIAKDFGFPIAVCVALFWAIKIQNGQLVKAYTDRISTLERIVRDLTTKVNDLEIDRLRRADEYGHTLKAIAVTWNSATKETNEVTKSALAVMRRLCDSISTRPCMASEYDPHPHVTRPPSSNEIPPARLRPLTECRSAPAPSASPERQRPHGSARTAGASFTITSSSGTDTSSVAWIIFEPS